MQENLWGEDEEILIQRKPKRTTSCTELPPLTYTKHDCLYFGHSWQVVGMLGEKQCTVCGVKGYCPGCMPNPPEYAQPFYCTRHTPPTESVVQL